MSRYKKVILFITAILIIIPLSIYGYVQYKLKDITVTSTYKSKIQEVNGITNILLLGTDGRKGDSNFRTDSMIILTIDNNNKNIKLTSLARDTYVSIPGRDKGKLNTAYFWGGENLLFETIENEFGIGIDKYAIVDFSSLMDIIYTLDGVQLNIKESELAEVNKYIPECYDFCNNPNKGQMKLIEKAGKQTVNGYQALSYSRIRKNDSAIFRDGRQRKVIYAVIKKYKDLPLTKYPKLIDTIIPYVSTNLTSSEITAFTYTGYNILSGKSLEKVIKEGEFPITDEIHSKGDIYKNAGWVWLYDINSTYVLRDFIYNDINMEDNEYLLDNSNIILNY